MELRLNAVRHCTYYCQPCMINRCTRHVWLFVIYRALMDIVVDYPCIADMHGTYFFCQPTAEYIVVYRALMDFHCVYRASSIASTVHWRYARHVLSYHHGVYYYVVFRLLGIRLLVFLWGRNRQICVVGICCGCPPFLFLSRSRLNGLER